MNYKLQAIQPVRTGDELGVYREMLVGNQDRERTEPAY